MGDDYNLLISIGILPKKAKEYQKNASLLSSIKQVVDEAGVKDGCEKSIGNLIYQVATKFPTKNCALANRAVLARYIAEEKITSVHFNGALAYLKKLGQKPVDIDDFEKECGVGVTITEDQVRAAVEALLKEKHDELMEKRYRINLGSYLNILRNQLKFVDGRMLISEFNKALAEKLGPKTEEDKKKPQQQKSKPKPKPKKAAKAESKETEITLPDSALIDSYLKPEENTQLTPELLEEHLKATGGRVVTRFPPEPNGYLHLGHCKAMNLNFNYAKKHNGWCYLRYDDTNPAAESQEYIDHIKEIVEWMGHKPYKITYSSDYFQELYDLAEKLIMADGAFVCHQTSEEMAKSREEKTPSPWRDRPKEESLKLFRDMKKGKYEEGKAVLRMKQDYTSNNPCMWDMVAYRIKYMPHPHAGDGWCIYPTYDYTHCLCDSLENITHSLCSMEFRIRRESYNWLCDILRVYRAPQIEFSRANVTHTVMSKRKINKLIANGHVTEWDDPRLPTIAGMRRRGYTPEAITTFCQKIGVSEAANTIHLSLLEQCVREDLNSKARRALVVLDPLKVTLTNYPEGKVEQKDALNFPGDPSRGVHPVPFSRVIYIDRSDFRLVPEKGYKRLAPGAEVGLRYAYNITCTDVVKDDNGEVLEILATVDLEKSRKPSGFIQWVAEPEAGKKPLQIEVHLYDHLFTEEFPGKLENFLTAVNPNSLKVMANAYADPSLADAKPLDKFQFERVGFFCMDTKSNVFNQTVGLRDTFGKKQTSKKQ